MNVEGMCRDGAAPVKECENDCQASDLNTGHCAASILTFEYECYLPSEFSIQILLVLFVVYLLHLSYGINISSHVKLLPSSDLIHDYSVFAEQEVRLSNGAAQTIHWVVHSLFCPSSNVILALKLNKSHIIYLIHVCKFGAC
jgi:hypothetical protein